MNLIGIGLIILIQSISIIGAVYVGYKIAQDGFVIPDKVSDTSKYVEYEDIPDSFIERVFGKKSESEVPRVQTMEERYDSEKRHAFFDD